MFEKPNKINIRVMLYSISKFTDRVMYVKLKIDYMQLKQCILWLLCVDFFVQYKRSLPDVIFFPPPSQVSELPSSSSVQLKMHGWQSRIHSSALEKDTFYFHGCLLPADFYGCILAKRTGAFGLRCPHLCSTVSFPPTPSLKPCCK